MRDARRRLQAVFAGAMLLVTMGIASPVAAANGDNLASFDAAVTAGIPACGSGVGTGVAYDVTTNSLVLSCWSSNVLERVDAATHLNDGALTIIGLPYGNDLGALAYDAGRNRLWACNGHSQVVLIDLTTSTVDLSVIPFPVAGCVDGLAYDGSDDTLWVSPDVSSVVYHYSVAGILLGSFPVTLGACGNSGIAVGGPLLYLANNGCSEIYSSPKDFLAAPTFFASSSPFRLEDLECDDETFASLGVGAIWSNDAYDRILNAWEIAAGACASGGGAGDLTLTPATDENPVGSSHTVTAHLSDNSGPIANATILFSVSGANTTSGTGTTDVNGEATFTYTGTSPGNDTISACYDANNNASCDVDESTATATKVWAGAGPPANLALTPDPATNVVDSQHCVTATVTDANGTPTPGITVEFSVSGSVTASGSAVTDASGQAEFCYTGPGLPGADDISAFADTNGTGVQDPGEPGDTATKTWVLPASTPGCKVTYGGRITAANGDKATFGGNAKADGLTGQEEYQDHGPAMDINVHSIDVTSVTCSADGTQASIFGTATINGSGTFNYRIDLKDLTEPGSTNTYQIRLSNGYDSGEQTLNRGNVQIH